LLSTTVIAANAATADAFATAFMVMGLEKTKAFVAQHPELEVYLIFSDSTGEFQHFATERIQEILLMNEI
jgi:thiamine biosynthesis lipoprotein